VIWSSTEKPFECADYFVPQDRLPPDKMKELLKFLADKSATTAFSKVPLVFFASLSSIFPLGSPDCCAKGTG
jgi:hypothetical protein